MTTESPDLDQLRFPILLALVSRTWRKNIDRRLQQYQLSEATWLPLVYLSRLDKPIRQKELAAMLSLDSSSVVRVLNNLEQLGLIERPAEVEDRRAKATQITEKGKQVVKHVEGVSINLESEIKSQLDPEAFETSRKLLKDIVKILHNI